MIAYFEIDEKGKVLYGCTTAREGTVKMDVTEDLFFNIRKYVYKNGKFIIDENYVEPIRPKTKLQILEEENEKLKTRVEIMQGALDALIMNTLKL